MASLFDANTRKKLQSRQTLDRLEAEYGWHLSELERLGFDALVSEDQQLSKTVDRWQRKRQARRFRRFAHTNPHEVVCSHGKMGGGPPGVNEPQYCDVFFHIPDGGGLAWLTVVTIGHAFCGWERDLEIAREEGDRDRIRALLNGGLAVILEYDHVVVEVPHLTHDSLEQGVRLHLGRVAPALARLPIGWVTG